MPQTNLCACRCSEITAEADRKAVPSPTNSTAVLAITARLQDIVTAAKDKLMEVSLKIQTKFLPYALLVTCSRNCIVCMIAVGE